MACAVAGIALATLAAAPAGAESPRTHLPAAKAAGSGGAAAAARNVQSGPAGQPAPVPGQSPLVLDALPPASGVAPVEQSVLAPIGSPGAGAPAVGRGGTVEGFPADPWGSLTLEEVEGLLGRVVMPTRSPVLAGLWRRLLISDGTLPGGGHTPGRFTGLRLAGLFRAGLLEDASNLAASLPGEVDPRVMLTGAQADLARGETARACKVAREVLPQAAGLPQRLREEALLAVAYCAAADRNAEAAGLAGDLLRDQGIDRPVAMAVLDSIAESRTPKIVRPREPDLIDHLFLALVGSADGENETGRASPALLVTLASRSDGAPRTRIAAAEHAVAIGALDADALARAYGALELEPDQVESPLVSDLDGPLWRAQLFQAVAAARDPAAKARYARAMLQSAREDDVLVPVLTVLAEPVADLPQQPGLAWFSETAVEIALASGRYGTAVRWTLYGSREAGDSGPAILSWLTLIDIGDPEAHVARGSSLKPLQEAAASGALEPELLHRLATVLDALGYNVPIPLWDLASRTPQPQSGHLPETGVLAALHEAAGRGETGRVVLLSMLALGPQGPSGAHLIALGDVIKALRAVGLDADARRIGFEALFAAWPRRAAT